MSYKLYFVKEPNKPALASFDVAGPSPDISVGDFVQLPLGERTVGFRIRSVMHRFLPDGNIESYFDCDSV